MKSSFVDMVSQMITTWAVGELKNTVATLFGSTQRTAIGTAASATAMSTKAVEAGSVLSSNAVEAASGAAASVAAIPVVGWASAPGVFASILALVLGAAGSIGSAEGGYDIPSGINPMTQLHEKEMVLPAKHADVIRAMADGEGGGSGGDVHVHFNGPTDKKSVAKWLSMNKSGVAGAAKDFARNNGR
jgi:hypothetical protein